MLRFAGVWVALLGVYLGIARPWFRTWGATPSEQAGALPGDGMVMVAGGQETRALTIHASSEVVFLWLSQLGQDRSGFYSYDLLENLVGCEMPVDERLEPGKQGWFIGERLWMYPPHKAGGVAYATLRTYIPGRALGFATRSAGASPDQPENGSWTFVVEPIGEKITRLIVRGRIAPTQSRLGSAFDTLVFEPSHFAMERRMMLGIKELAETGTRNRLGNHVEVAAWAVVFLSWTILSYLSIRTGSAIALLGMLSTGLLFQALTFLQPAAWIEVPLALATVYGVRMAWPAKAKRRRAVGGDGNAP